MRLPDSRRQLALSTMQHLFLLLLRNSIHSERTVGLAFEMPDVRGKAGLEFFQLVLVNNFPFAVVVQIQEEYVFWAFHRLKCLVSSFKQARHIELKNPILLCVKVFSFETVVVASAASDFEDFVEAPAQRRITAPLVLLATNLQLD